MSCARHARGSTAAVLAGLALIAAACGGGDVAAGDTVPVAAADGDFAEDGDAGADEFVGPDGGGASLDDFGGAVLATDAEGVGRLVHVFTHVAPGTYSMNVNLVTGAEFLSDPRHREMGAADAPTVVVGGDGQPASGPTGPVTVFGDGEIGCPNHVADDRSLPVGTVQFEPGDREVRVIIELTDAAPNHDYYVELWHAQPCTMLAP